MGEYVKISGESVKIGTCVEGYGVTFDVPEPVTV